MPEIQATAKELEHLSREHLETHETYEEAATLFHIAIAIVAIAVVAGRKEFWYVSMAAGVVGVVFFSQALVRTPPRFKEEQESVPKSVPAHTTDTARPDKPS